MTSSADPYQVASSEINCLDLQCLQRQGMSGFRGTRVNWLYMLLQCENFIGLTGYTCCYSVKTLLL